MTIPTKYPRLMYLLLIIAPIIFITSDQNQFHLKQTIQSITHEETPGNQNHNHSNEGIDHSNPKNQKRMGIYHYNEGNKFLKQNNWEEAIKNYKMALRHNKSFDETYINLSTAYLIGKQFEAALKTLNALQAINPKHPLLHYNLACYYSLTEKIALGLESLEFAVANGFNNIQILKRDPDLENLRHDPKFKKLQKSLLAKNT